MRTLRLFLFSIVAMLTLSVSTSAQTLTWSTEYQYYDVSNIGGGTTQRPTVASALWNNMIYIAYTSSDNCHSNGACAIRLKQGSGQGSLGNIGFTDWGILYVPGVGQVFSPRNPAMGSQNGAVYIAWTDESGNNWLSMSTDYSLSSWSAPIQITSNSLKPTSESIGLSFDASNNLWLSYMLSNQNPYLCEITPNISSFSSSVPSCSEVTTSGTQTLYNPGLVFSSSTVGSPYMFVTWKGNSHCLSSWYSKYGVWTYWNSGSLCGAQQTSSAPVPVFYNGYLYVGFRSNDSSAAFDLIGGTISTYPYYSWNRLPTGGQHMDGSPNLLPVTSNQFNGLLRSSEMLNFYVRGNYLYTVYGY